MIRTAIKHFPTLFLLELYLIVIAVLSMIMPPKDEYDPHLTYGLFIAAGVYWIAVMTMIRHSVHHWPTHHTAKKKP